MYPINVSFVTPPEHISGRWILVPFGDTVSQTNVLSFARINAVSALILGDQLSLPDPLSRMPMTKATLTMPVLIEVKHYAELPI